MRPAPRFFILIIAIFISLFGCERKPINIPPQVVADGTGSAMDAFLSRLTAFGFHGSVLVARGDEILLHKAYGLARVPGEIANTTSTAFSTGSVTKQFTAAAILKLEMDGRLSTSDSITRFFDNVPDDKTGVTLHHLLTHSSGLPGELGHDEEELSREDFISRAFNCPLAYPTGDHYEYSNAGYSLLAAVIEVVTGMEYEAFLQQRLFAPLGMHITGLKQIQWDDSLVACSHNKDLGYPSPLHRPDEYFNLKGNGGILSTPADMIRWHRALHNGELLSETARRKLFTPYIREYEDGDSYYGYGWVIEEYDQGDTVIWHNGGAMPHGWSCAVYHFAAHDVICIVFANATIDGSLPVDDIVSIIAPVAMGKEVMIPYPPRTVEVDPDSVSWIAGTYSFEGGIFEVYFTDGRIHIAPEGQEAMTALFSSPYDKMLARYNDKTVEVIRLLASGNYNKASSYFRPDPEGNIWRLMSREWWQAFSSLGSFKDVTPLGTVFTGGAHTYCRLRFDRGSEVCRFFWMGGECGGMMVVERPLTREFLPQSNTQFAGYSLKNGSAVKAEFDRNGEMRLTSTDETIIAKKGNPAQLQD